VAKFGPAQFELVGGADESDKARIAELEAELSKLKAQGQRGRTPGDPTPENLLHSPAVAPGGQVSTGYQGKPPEGAEAQLLGEGADEGDDKDGKRAHGTKAHGQKKAH
jgi:hypothetical protein